MGLLSNPVTLSDGTANHIYNFRGQVVGNGKSVVGEYLEPAAAALSKLAVKQDDSGSIKRRLFQTQRLVTGSDGKLYLDTVNTSHTYHELIPIADVKKSFVLHLDAFAEAGFSDNFHAGLI